MRKLLATLVAACGLLTATQVGAQDFANFPNRAVKIIVSAPPGGGVDIVARVVADRLQQRWRHPVVVENRPGAGGNIGAEAVAMAEPDGYTLLAAQPAPLTTNIVLYKKLNFDPSAFESLSIMTSIPNLLMVRPDFPAKTLQEFIAYAKANPGKINYGSQGVGTTPHLTAALFETAADIKLTHIPHRGTAAMVNNLIAGHIDMTFIQMQQAVELHRAGNARVLGITTMKREASLPDIPTFDEAGIRGFTSDTWNAIVAPPRTPAALVAKISGAIHEVLHSAEVVVLLQKLAMNPIGGTPAEVSAFIKDETQRWSKVIRAAGIKPN